MNMTDAFAPPLTCTLIDSSTLRFARADADCWAKWYDKLDREHRDKRLGDLMAAQSLSPTEKATMRGAIVDDPIADAVVWWRVLNVRTHTAEFVRGRAEAAGESGAELDRKLRLVPPADYRRIADLLAHLPLVKEGEDAPLPLPVDGAMRLVPSAEWARLERAAQERDRLAAELADLRSGSTGSPPPPASDASTASPNPDA